MAPFALMTGPLFVGSILSWGLFGASVIQLYDYFVSYQHTDRMFIKTIVYCIFVVELLQTAFTTHTAWVFLIKGWGNPEAFDTSPWSAMATPALNSIVSLVVQMFFARRIWILTSGLIGRFVSILTIVIGFMQCACGLASVVQYSLTLHLDPRRLHALNVSIVLWLSGSLACDILIAVAMVILLARMRRSSLFKSTEALINNLIINTIETGAVTAIVAGAQLIMYLKSPNNFLHVVPLFVLGRLYSNVLLAALNGRQRARQSLNVDFSAALEQPNIRPQGPTSGPMSFFRIGGIRAGSTAPSVQVTTQVQSDQQADASVDESDCAAPKKKLWSL